MQGVAGGWGMWGLVGVAVIAGMLLPLQPGINAELRAHLRSATGAAAVSFAVGLAILLIAWTASRGGVPRASDLAAVPWWGWTGGAIGAGFVLASLVLAPKLGATLLVGSVVTGQLVASLVLDRFGLVGYKPQPITPGRVLGVALLVVGVLLVQLSGGEKRSDPAAVDLAQAPPAEER